MTPSAFLRLDFGVTPLSMPFVGLLAVLTAAVVLWSLRRGRRDGIAMIVLFSVAMLGVLTAQSVAAFFLAWETMSLLSAILVAAHHEERRVRRATLTYLIVAQGGAFCIAVALSLLATAAGTTSFPAIAAAARNLPPAVRDAAVALALAGFGSKAGLLPLHFWLPRAHPVAPANVSALLSGVMLKVAIYGLSLVLFELAAPVPVGWGIAILVIGTISAIAGVLYALVDHDLKRLLAYHSIENVGIITIGLGVAVVASSSGDRVVAALALAAALFHTINHGLFKGLLFLGAGTVAEAEGTVDLERLGGLWSRLVWTAPLFLAGCVAIAGLPPFNGFASEWMTFQSLIAGLASTAAPVRLVLAGAIAGLALTSGLAVACFVKVFGVAFLGRTRHPGSHASPLRERFDVATLGPALLAALCALLGFAPMLVVAPLATVAGTTLHVAAPAFPSLPVLPASLAVLPIAGALGVLWIAGARGVRRVPTWTCGSPVTAAAQYTATAFSKPLRLVFAFLPLSVFDEAARGFAALTLRWMRHTRVLQSGELRLYLVYAMAAFIFVIAVTR